MSIYPNELKLSDTNRDMQTEGFSKFNSPYDQLCNFAAQQGTETIDFDSRSEFRFCQKLRNKPA